MITKIGLYRDPRKTKQWVVRWFGEYEPATGKQKRYSKSFQRKRDAETFQTELAMSFQQGQQRDKAEEITLKDFTEDWLKIREPELRPASLKLYGNTISRLYDYFGQNYLLSKVMPRSAAKFMSELRRMDSKEGELSDWVRHRVHRNCKTMFKTAVSWGLLVRNPFKDVTTPRLVTRRWHYLKPAEYRKLLKVAPNLRWKAIYALVFTTGLRFGELFNLTWKDIDFDTGEVRVENRSSTETMPPFYVKDYEARRIPLPKHTLDILTQLQAEAPEKIPYAVLSEKQHKTMTAKWQERQRQKQDWKNQDMVNNVGREFKRHIKWAGIKPTGTLSIHTLRKSCIQNWANELPINVTKELAGHSSIVTTQKYYLQVDEYHRVKAAAVIDALIESGEEEEKIEMTDARLTPSTDFRQSQDNSK